MDNKNKDKRHAIFTLRHVDSMEDMHKVFLIMSCLVLSPSLCNAYLICGSSMVLMPGDDDKFVENFISVMENLSEVIKEKHSGTSYMLAVPRVYGLIQCYNFLDREHCELCFSEARERLSHCLPLTGGRVFLDGCFLRYDYYDFFWEPSDANYDRIDCGTSNTTFFKDRQLDFAKVDAVISNVTERALQNGRYSESATSGDVNVYAMAQCLETIDQEGCGSCLLDAGVKVKTCAPKTDGRTSFTGCHVRYSTTNFLNPVEPHKKSLISILLSGIRGCTLAAILFLSAVLLALIGAFIGYKKLSAKSKAGDPNSQRVKKLNLNFDYELLAKATDYFDSSRKLGRGGNGSVYRGTLPDGKNIAVKRLFFNTRQWADLFFNEVNSISKVQHKNLVRLLGCSIEGPECLLVYEYVPNRSLDNVLFNLKDTIHILNWQQKHSIILGVAEGLAYLHSGSAVKVIHRDIKCSNILLDMNLEPKIADFGLVRCYETDESHISTGIKGTLGYMAPEYLVHGRLTEKADVYSFGVLIMEIATGRKNSAFCQGSGSILHMAWKHYNSKTATSCIDNCLRGNFPEEEALSVLQVGLLCTQASAVLRPSMQEVVKMLKDKSCIVPSPQQPPFLNACVLNPDDCTNSCCIDIHNSN